MAEEDGEARRDVVTDVEQTGWLARLGQSFAGVLFGFIMIAGACVLLFWNEGRAIQTARSLTEGGGVVRAVDAGRIDPANEGKLVHVAGLIAVSGPVLDAEFGMRSSGLRLIRRVEMYQWTEEETTETKKKLGGSEEKTTTYKYNRAWSDKPVDSSRFRERAGHANPQMTWHDRNQLAAQPRIGAFAVPGSLLANFGAERPLAANDDQTAALRRKLNKPVQVLDGVIYIARDPAQPAVGDVRITYSQVPLQDASVVARQAGNGLAPYQTTAGGTIELIAAGVVPAAQMFKAAQDDNRMWTWLIRAGGCLLMFIGFGLIMGPLGVLGDLIPFIGDVVRAGTGLIGLLLTAVLAPIVIAVGWLFYRPAVAVGILVIGGIVAYAAIRIARQRKQRQVAAV
jgi:Transmembrane protein 43